METRALKDQDLKSVLRSGVSAGSQIGPYTLVERVGRGGQADVWSAWDTRLNRTVAIKLIDLYDPQAPVSSGRRFAQEAQTIAALEHPHIVPLYDFGETEGFRYLVMRYMPGGSLLSRLQRAPFTVEQALRMAFPLASALDYTHARNVVHRDLKSGNVLLDLEGRPYLADFGLARETRLETLALHSRTGTLPYMSPEQLNGQALTYKSDLYSFGILLYEMFCGHLPFDGSVALAVAQLQSDQPLPDLSPHHEALPPEVGKVLRELTALDPDRRPGSATEAVQRLAEALSVTVLQGAPRPATLDWEDAHLLDTADRIDTARIQAREAERLLQREIEHWRGGAAPVTLSVTHFVLIDQFYAEAQRYGLEVTDETARFLLRAALLHDYHVRHWWDAVPDSGDRLLACWDMLRQADAEIMPRLLERIVSLEPGTIPTTLIMDILDRVAATFDDSEARAQGLAFLREIGGMPRAWRDVAFTPRVDAALADLALSDSPEADAAAALIGRARSLAGVRALLSAFQAGDARAVRALAHVRAEVDHLPREAPLRSRAATLFTVLWRQLAYDRQEMVLGLVFAVAGCGLALGLMHFILTPASIAGPMFRVTDSVNAGIILGLTVGLGVGVVQVIVERWRALALWLRLAVGVAPGFALAWLGFYGYTVLFQKFAPEGWALPAGALVWVLGFALGQGVARRAWARAALGGAGVWLALIGTWWVSSMNTGPTPNDPLIYLAFPGDPNLSQPFLLSTLVAAVAGVVAIVPGWALHRYVTGSKQN